MTIGDILKDYRKKHELSQDKFVEKSGISKGYVSMLENNTNARNGKPIQPTIETLRKLACGMDIELDDLLKLLDGKQEISLSIGKERNEIGKFPSQLSNLITKAQQLNQKGVKELEKHADLLLLSDEYRKINAKERVM